MNRTEPLPAAGSPPAHRLEWDTRFFGFPIAQVAGPAFTPELMPRLEPWCREHQIRCLCCLLEEGDAASRQMALAHGFAFVDTQTVLLRRITVDDARKASAGGGPVRLAGAADAPALVAVARECAEATRYERDPHFPREQCAGMIEAWVVRTCRSTVEKVFLAGESGGPAAFLVCQHEAGRRLGGISLVGVRAQARGRGLGTMLVRTALGWLAEQGAEAVSVSVLGANLAAQRLYAQAGFEPHRTLVWYHRWIG